MNEQKLFDASLKHIRAQGKQSVQFVGGSMCMYRGVKDLGCAFAPAIEKYDEDMECQPASILLRDYSDNIYPMYRNINTEFANALQSCHDTVYIDHDFMTEFEANMSQLAEQWKLGYE